ncbi:MAG: outer membrane beta-barrel protein [Chitinophagaceae bacterium]|nr:outer membrane beta-barrel protein [Chitinophagaceae bacterium]
MKKIIIFSLMLISAFTVDAQRKRTRTATSQGNVVVRFGMGLNSSKVDPDLDELYKSTSFNFSPSVGYMVIDNLELGVDFMVDYMTYEDFTKQSPVNKVTGDHTDVGFGVYAQKYFPLNNWFSLTTSANLGMKTGTYNRNVIVGAVNTVDPTGTGTRNGVGGSINFGMGFTPYNAFGLFANIASLGVQTMKEDDNNSNDTVNSTDAGFNVWRQSSVSFVWFFGRGLWKK